MTVDKGILTLPTSAKCWRKSQSDRILLIMYWLLLLLYHHVTFRYICRVPDPEATMLSNFSTNFKGFSPLCLTFIGRATVNPWTGCKLLLNSILVQVGFTQYPLKGNTSPPKWTQFCCNSTEMLSFFTKCSIL